MNIKYILVIAVVVGAIYTYTKTPSTLDVLLTSVSDDAFSGEQIISDTAAQQRRGVFDVADYLEPGRITIVEFYTRRCPGCRRLEGYYQYLFKARPDVVVKRILMPDTWSVSWARKQFDLDIGSTPHVMIYGIDGLPIALDEGRNKKGFKLLYEWINKEKVGIEKKGVRFKLKKNVLMFEFGTKLKSVGKLGRMNLTPFF